MCVIALICSVNYPLEAKLSQERHSHLSCKFFVNILTVVVVVVVMKTVHRSVLCVCNQDILISHTQIPASVIVVQIEQ